jgi:hypothetical protein
VPAEPTSRSPASSVKRDGVGHRPMRGEPGGQRDRRHARHLLNHRQTESVVLGATSAVLFGNVQSEEAQFPRRKPDLARDVPLLLPGVDVISHISGEELPYARPKLLVVVLKKAAPLPQISRRSHLTSPVHRCCSVRSTRRPSGRQALSRIRRPRECPSRASCRSRSKERASARRPRPSLSGRPAA